MVETIADRGQATVSASEGVTPGHPESERQPEKV
jgi:hypothetical protein